MKVYTAAEIEKVLALTVLQPYSHLISIGKKPIENREHRRYSHYRGPLIIHAGKSMSMCDPDDLVSYPKMPFGAIESVAFMHSAASLALLPPELRGHEHAFGPECLLLRDVWQLPRPIPVSGAQGLWKPKPEILAAIIEQLP